MVPLAISQAFLALSRQLVLGVDRVFTYDHVLEANSEQHKVYDECVKPLVRGPPSAHAIG